MSPAGPAEAVPVQPARAASPSFEIQTRERKYGGTELSTQVGNCGLHLTLAGARLWLRAETPDFRPSADCSLLTHALRPAWVALAEHARQQLPPQEKLGLVVGFYTDLPSVETWFRHQAADPALQKHLRTRHDAAYNDHVAAQMLASGALSRYGELLGAMGFDIAHVSIEKVEVRSAKRWREAVPESATWQLPPARRLALPYLTWLDLRPR